MKSFFKNVIANIVAIMIVIAIGILALLMMIAASALSGSEKAHVKNNSVLTANTVNHA